MDKGLRKAKKSIIEKLIIPNIDFTTIHQKKIDPKSQVIVWGQKEKREITFVSKYSKEVYEVQLLVDDNVIAEAKHTKKKEAEKLASKKAISQGLLK